MDKQGQTATQIAYEDRRLRMIAQSCAAIAMQEYGPIDPERSDRSAHDIALHAAMLAVTRLVEGDAEINAARIERDHYKALAEQHLRFSPPAILIKTDGGSYKSLLEAAEAELRDVRVELMDKRDRLEKINQG